MTPKSKYVLHGAILVIAPLFVALIFEWYLLVFAYYLVLFGIFIYSEYGWKGVIFHILFFGFIFWLGRL